MKNSNNGFKFFNLFSSIITLIIPILIIYVSIIATANIFPNEVIYYRGSSLFLLSFKIFLFSLALDAILSLFGVNYDFRISLISKKFFTSLILELSLSIFTMTVGYSLIRYLGLTDCIFFRTGLAFFVVLSSILDLACLIFIKKILKD